MKTLFLIAVISFTSSVHATEYKCYGGAYKVDLQLSQDKSTYMHLTERYQTLATGYAKSISTLNSKTTFHFLPQMGPVDLIIKFQDIVERPEELRALLRHQSPFLSIRQMLDCTRE